MPHSPYTPPSSEAKPPPLCLRATGFKTALIGTTLFALPVIAQPITSYMIDRSMLNFVNNHSTYDSHTKNIILIIKIFALTLIPGLIGAICILTSLFSMKNREKWFFYTAIITYGFIIGLPIIITFLIKRKEFLTNNRPKPTNPPPTT